MAHTSCEPSVVMLHIFAMVRGLHEIDSRENAQ